MSGMDDLVAKAKALSDDHPDLVEKASDQAIERAGEAADRGTGDKFSAQIEKGEHLADDHIGE